MTKNPDGLSHTHAKNCQADSRIRCSIWRRSTRVPRKCDPTYREPLHSRQEMRRERAVLAPCTTAYAPSDIWTCASRVVLSRHHNNDQQDLRVGGWSVTDVLGWLKRTTSTATPHRSRTTALRQCAIRLSPWRNCQIPTRSALMSVPRRPHRSHATGSAWHCQCGVRQAVTDPSTTAEAQLPKLWNAYNPASRRLHDTHRGRGLGA